MKTAILITCFASPAVWVASIAQAVPVAAAGSAVSWLQGVSSLGFAGLVWYMLTVRDPRRDKESAVERSDFLAAIKVITEDQKAERADHRTERIEWRGTIDTVSERSRDSAKDGHASAAALTQQLQRIIDERKA